MKSRALLLQYEELSRNPHSLVFKSSQGRKMLFFSGAWEMCWITQAFLVTVVKIRRQFNQFWHFQMNHLSCRVSRRWCRPCGNVVSLQLFSTSRWRKEAEVPTQQRWAWGVHPAKAPLALCDTARELPQPGPWADVLKVGWRGCCCRFKSPWCSELHHCWCSANRLVPAGTALQGLLTSSVSSARSRKLPAWQAL